MLAAIAEDPDTLVILDGYYYTVPAVTHKEILYALNAGVRVIGAASMGALRAAELAPFGMLGAGKIFRWYRDGAIEGDDEVAILHGDAEDGYRPLTVALVEVRHALEALVASGEVADGEARRLVDCLRRTPFTERRPHEVLRHAGDVLGRQGRRALEHRLASASLKQDDAREALELARTPHRRRPPGDRPPTAFLNADREWYLRPGGDGPPLLRIWNVVQLLHPRAPELVDRLRRRWTLATAARQAGIEPDEGRVAEIAAALERRLDGRYLAVPELREEARALAGAEAACRRLGGVEPACADLARRLGIPPHDAARRLPRLLAAAPGALAAWWLCRAFVFSAAFPAARRAAAAVAEVQRCLEVWARGARIREDDLTALAAELWQCDAAAVASEAERRGLAASPAIGPGRREALEWIAAAERLPRPINDYPAARRALRATDLEPFPIRLPADT